MFVIMGSKMRRTVTEFKEGIETSCCDDYLGNQFILMDRQWFTFFFIPIFPFGKKKYYVGCAKCEQVHSITNEIAETILAEAN